MGPVGAFGEAAAALDEAEDAAGNRIGGPTEGDVARVALLEARVAALRPKTAWDWRWAARRACRAMVNDWGADRAEPLIQIVGDPATVGCSG